MQANRADIFKNLQEDILRLQGFKSANNAAMDIGLGPIKEAFPKATFPLGAVHEFLSSTIEDTACTGGFIAGLLSSLTENNGVTFWVSSSRTLFPPALKSFGLESDHFIFIDLHKEKDVIWAMEEALKCGALSAVVGEVREIDFTTSRRLQLAAEQSQVTGFIVRKNYRNRNTNACVSRWKITSLPSAPVTVGTEDDLPGIGFPKWRVELLRIRNGKPGIWDVLWKDGRFVTLDNVTSILKSDLPFASAHNPWAGKKRKAG